MVTLSHMADDTWRRWTPDAQARALVALRELDQDNWAPFYCKRPGCDGDPHDDWTWQHARADQHPPPGEAWRTWLLRGGRGSGKTRTGTEWMNRRVEVSPLVALIAPTGPAARDVMVEGESGILRKSKPGKRPTWEPSKRKLTWPNGAIGYTYSAEEPDRLRGPQHYDAWLDEPAHMPLIDDVWANLSLGLRLKRERFRPKILCTTTPLPVPWLKKLVLRPTTVSTVVSTYANIKNLDSEFASTVLEEYEGTRRGRQEIHGEILQDVEGALWNNDMIEFARVREVSTVEMDRLVVAIDPAGTATSRSDETGIIVVGSKGSEFYILEDASGKYSPNGWAQRALGLVDKWTADYIVAEKNYGGNMVRSVLESEMKERAESVRVETVTSRRGKAIRADPIVALYEKQRVHHVGVIEALEDQLTSWVPGKPSPDRLDALVHGVTALSVSIQPATISSPSQFMERYGRTA
jgi:phage terminase large subunit-like protein